MTLKLMQIHLKYEFDARVKPEPRRKSFTSIYTYSLMRGALVVNGIKFKGSHVRQRSLCPGDRAPARVSTDRGKAR